MARQATNLSVSDLERLLDSRRTQLDRLVKKRERLQRDLDRIQQKISGLEGARLARGPKRRKLGRRVKNAKPLRAYVLDVLGKSKKGFSLADLEQKVLEAGYQSKSAKFRTVLYQCLYNTEGIVHDENTGAYRLQS